VDALGAPQIAIMEIVADVNSFEARAFRFRNLQTGRNE
jgi:hypothetical protein